MHDAGVFVRLARAPDAVSLWCHVAAAAVLYGASMALLAFAWHALLKGLGVGGLGRTRTMAIYATSQFGKYFPGSVLQYVGRHTLLRQQGLTHRLLLLCALLEAALLIAAALAWAAPLATLYVPIDVPLAWGVIVAGLASAGWLLQRHALKLGEGTSVALRWLAVAFACYIGFFGTMGLTFDLASGFAGTATVPVATRYAAVAASWIAGFVIIGAPAGIGVREAVFLALMAGALSSDATLAAVSAFRIATFGGDLLAFVVAWPVLAAARAAASEHT